MISLSRHARRRALARSISIDRDLPYLEKRVAELTNRQARDPFQIPVDGRVYVISKATMFAPPIIITVFTLKDEIKSEGHTRRIALGRRREQFYSSSLSAME